MLLGHSPAKRGRRQQWIGLQICKCNVDGPTCLVHLIKSLLSREVTFISNYSRSTWVAFKKKPKLFLPQCQSQQSYPCFYFTPALKPQNMVRERRWAERYFSILLHGKIKICTMYFIKIRWNFLIRKIINKRFFKNLLNFCLVLFFFSTLFFGFFSERSYNCI